MAAQGQRVRDEILEGALDIAPEHLDSYLKLKCGTDGGLRAEVENLLTSRSGMKDDFFCSEDASSPFAILTPGKKLKRYLIESVISRGGMSVVYKAQDPVIGRTVAIKVLTSTAGMNTGLNEQFMAEVKMLGSVRHPNVVQVFDYGYLKGVPYIVMEYLNGQDLAHRITNQACGDLIWKLKIASQLAAALLHVHRSGVVHRDVKPANVFIDSADRAILMDFGISRFDSPGVTRTATLIGTLEYLSPELLEGKHATANSDIYSYGILLFELFTSRKAFLGTTAQILDQIARKGIPFEVLNSSGLPPSLVRLIRLTTRRDPTERPADFKEIYERLTEVENEPIGRRFSRLRNSGWAIFAAAGIVLISAISFLPLRHRAETSSKTAESPSVLRGKRQDPPQVHVPEPVSASNHPSVSAGGLLPSNSSPSPVSIAKPTAETPDRGVRVGLAPSHDPQHTALNNPPPLGSPISTEPIQFEAPAVLPPASLTLERETSPPGVGTPAASVAVSRPLPVSPKTLEATPSRATAEREVLGVLQRYVSAYTAKDLGRVSAVFPTMSASDRKKLSSAFSVAKTIELQLLPEEDPKFDPGPGGSLDLAVVKCKRVLQMTPFAGRSPRPQSDVCIFRLERVKGSWQIMSQQSF